MNVTKFTTLFICLIMFTFNNALAQNYTQDSKVLLKNLQRKIIHTLLYVSENEVNAGKKMHDFSYNLSLPANQHFNLGLVIGPYNSGLGYEVISVTPGSEAEEQGIKVHDYITEINQIAVEKLPTSEILNVLYKLKADQNLTLGIKSGNDFKTISPKLSVIDVPRVFFNVGARLDNVANQHYPENSCGRVTVHIRPPSSMGSFGAFSFRRIDNRGVSYELNTAKLSAGKHQIDFARSIFNGDAVFEKLAPIEIDIQPNKRYFVAEKIINGTRKIVNWRTETDECINN
ncbi:MULTISPECIES: PDZ domain-containing protein [unclassified Pseudoalteromonas]|uniref:PDZ domain-containing protein n=1 Tax=unclassified Pseudoalteromonas TaxID=194690 RepID=UPI0005AA0D5C|nr:MULTISPECIES: PDZ domain-containing protein [unclassified Pseudoalteromonas]